MINIADVQLNEVTIETLFDQYEKIGFIYPAKKELLRPYFQQITENWEKLKADGDELLWIFNNAPNARQDFASVSAWKQSNYGMMSQHLVSNGNGLMPLKVMMAAQHRAEHNFDENEVRSSQNWFRPDNRYAYRVFASMFKKLGAEHASLRLFHYLHLQLDDIPGYIPYGFRDREVTGYDADFVRFVERQYGAVFVRSEELDQEDIQLEAIGKRYEACGLHRSRKIIKIEDTKTGEIVAAVVANRAPLGLNFSFLENRAYYIIDENIDDEKRTQVVKAINAAIKSYYEDFDLQAIPIVTDEATSDILKAQKAKLFKKYMQSIWMREGFAMWYAHIYSFLEKLEARWKARLAA